MGKLLKNISNKLSFEIVALFFFFLLIGFYSLDWNLENYKFKSNDGPSYLCSFFGWELFHFGLPNVIACTYDHQPLYFIFLKAIRFLSFDGLTLIRFFHQLIWSLCGVLLYKISRDRGHLKLISFLFSLLIFTTPFLFDLSLQIRMYTLYLLIFLILFRQRENASIDSWPIVSTVYVGYFTFIFILVPVAYWILCELNEKKFKNVIKSLKKYIPLLLLVSFKFIYVFHHRLIRREWPSVSWFNSHDIWRHLVEMVSPVAGWPFTYALNVYDDIGLLISIILLILIILDFKSSDSKLKTISGLCIFSYSVILLLRYVFKIEEIEYRYVLYVTPLAYLLSLKYFEMGNRLVKNIYYFVFTLIIVSNISWFNRQANAQNEQFVEIDKLNKTLKQNNIKTIYTYNEYRDNNYIASYLKLFLGEEIKFLNINPAFNHFFFTGTQYLILESHNPPYELKNIKELKSSLNVSLEKFYCVDLEYPKFCLYKVKGNSRFDHLPDSEISKFLVPLNSKPK